MDEKLIVLNLDPLMQFACSHGRHADELTIVLKGHLVVEYMLDSIIKEKFKNPNKILSYSFYRKLEILHSLGFLPDYLFKNIETLNKIRNKYAHDLKYSLDINELFVIDSDDKQITLSSKSKKYTKKSTINSFCAVVIMQLHAHYLVKLGINSPINW